MSELNADNIKVNSVEEAWKIAVGEGYQGTLEDYAILCAKLASEVKLDEKLNVEEMDTVAGGGFVEAMEAAGEWIKDNALVVGLTAAGVAAAVGAAVLIKSDRNAFEKLVSQDRLPQLHFDLYD